VGPSQLIASTHLAGYSDSRVASKGPFGKPEQLLQGYCMKGNALGVRPSSCPRWQRIGWALAR
jgi:hypothetical protein